MVSLVITVSITILASLVSPVAAQPVPLAPTGLAAEYRPAEGAVALTWMIPPVNAAGPAVGFNIDRDGGYYSTVAAVGEFIDRNVVVGTTYEYEVSAFSGSPDRRAYGSKSEKLEFTVAAVPGGGDSGSGGDGPLQPTNLAAVPVTGETDAVNPDGIKVSWTPGGGPESIGFNVSRNGDFLLSIVGRSWFVDCDVVSGISYTYTVSAWSAGPLFSFTSEEASATAGVTPAECRPLTPPGPGGPDGPFEDPIFDVSRDVNAKPATPQNVRIVGDRLQWDMPRGPRQLFQISRNSDTDRLSERWGQLSITSGHPDLQYGEQSNGDVRFSIPISQFSPGDRFSVTAIHPYDITEVPDNARFSKSSRYATITNPDGKTIGNFLSSFGTDDLPSGTWIGDRDDWNPIPQFSDGFNDGDGKLVDRVDPGWYFARSDGDTEITPAPTRDPKQTDQRAVKKDGKLEMSAGIDDGTYSYIGTADNNGNGYMVDPTNGVFIEASVRLDRMTPADNAWWAFWLMTPGGNPCDADGNPTPGGFNAYDGHAETGTEIDIFEFVPDLANGFNQALFRYESQDSTANCTRPDQAKLAPEDRGFTYEGIPLPGVNMPNYMDGNYHRLGMYYAQDCYAFYIDDEMIWSVDEASNPGWVTRRAKESIRLTWEIQNRRRVGGDQISNPWTSRGGHFSNTALDRDPTVYIDFVNVWEKKESANGLCSGGPDPVLEPEPDPDANPEPGPETGPGIGAPTDVSAVASDQGVSLSWTPGEGFDADGYDVRRNGEGYWSVAEPEFLDEQVAEGETYTYAITPWIEGVGGDANLRTYGPASESVSVTAEASPDPDASVNGMAPPNPAVATRDGGAIWVNWTAGDGTTPDGYDIRRNDSPYWTVEGTNRFLDTSINAGEVYRYVVTPWVETDGDPRNRRYGAASVETSATGGTGPIPDLTPPEEPDPNAGPNYRQIFRDDFEGTTLSSNFSAPSWTAPDRVSKNSGTTCSQKDGKLHLAIEQVGDELLACYLISKVGNYGPGNDSTVKIEYRANVSKVKAEGAWFAGWVFPLGDTAGEPNAADGVPATGSEYDVFEYMPTNPDEYLTAVHDSDAIKLERWVDPSSLGIDLTDDEYHTFGLEWNKDCVAFFIDGNKVSSKNSDISMAKKHSIMLSMEAQTGTQWETWDVGNFGDNLATNTAEGTIDWIEVQKKKSLDPELCSDSNPEPGDNPETDRPEQVTNVEGASQDGNIKLTWSPATSGPTPDGFDIRRDGESYATVTADDSESTTSETCSGSTPLPGADPTDAKALYTSECGVTYSDNSGFHKCDWVTGGWICSGPRGSSSSIVPNEFTDDQVVDGQSYTYEVIPWVEAGDSRTFGTASTAVTVVAGAADPQPEPGPEPEPENEPEPFEEGDRPTNLTAVMDGPGVRVTWDGPSGPVDGYRILRMPGGQIAETTRSSYVDLRVRPDTEYTYRVSAFRERNGPGRDFVTTSLTPATVTTPADLVPLEAVGNVPDFRAIVVDETTVQMTWSPAPGPVDIYEVRRDWVSIKTIEAGEPLEWTDTNAVPGTLHRYQIAALTAPRGPDNERSEASSSWINIVTTDSLDIDIPLTLSPAERAFHLDYFSDYETHELISAYDVYRDGVLLRTVNTSEFTDPQGTTEETHTYYVMPWVRHNGERVYGNPSPTRSTADLDSPTSAPVQLTATASNTTATLSWLPPDDDTNVDGYAIQRNDTGSYRKFTTETEFRDGGVDAGILTGLDISGLQPDTLYTYTVRAFTGPEGSPLYGPPATVQVRTTNVVYDVPQPATDIFSFVEIDPATQNATATVQWRAPSDWRTNVTGYRVYFPGMRTQTVLESELSGTDEHPDLRTFVYGPITPTHPRYDEIADGKFGIRAFNGPEFEWAIGSKSNSSPSVGFWPNSPIVLPPPPAGTEHPAYATAVEVLFPDSTTERKAALARFFWVVNEFALSGETGISLYASLPSDAIAFQNWGYFYLFKVLLVTEGYVPPASNPEILETAEGLFEILADLGSQASTAGGLSAVIPGFRMPGDGPVGLNRGRLGSLTDRGWTREDRSRTYFANLPRLEEMLAALPDPPDSSSEVERIEILAFAQAKMLLDVQPSNRWHLWSVRNYIENGYHPTRRVDPPGSDSSYLEPAPNAFSRMWNASSKEERVAYFGFDLTGWELALPFIKLSKDMDVIQDDLDDWFTPLVKLIIGGAIAYVTGGAASGAYASYFGVSATSLGASAFGAGVGGFFSTLFLTDGDIDESIEGAWRGLLTAGFTHYSQIPVGERSHYQVFALAIIEGGIARLDGKDFQKAVLASLAKHYVPGLANFLEKLDNVSPFAAGLAGVLVDSYIRHGGEWELMSQDLEQYALDYAGAAITDYVGERLEDANWGSLGGHIADLTGLAVSSGGDPEVLRAEIIDRLASEMGENVRALFGDSDSFVEDLLAHLTETYIRAWELPEDQRAGHLDREMTAFLFDRAGEAISGGANDLMVSANGNQPSPLIDAFVGLIDVAVSNSWKSQEELEAAIATYVTNELKDVITGAVHSDCAPEWVNGLTAQLTDSIVDAVVSGNVDDIGNDVGSYLATTLENGTFDDAASDPAACSNPDGPPSGPTDPPGCETASQVSVSNGSASGGRGFSSGRVPTGPTLAATLQVLPQIGGVCASAAAFHDWLIDLNQIAPNWQTIDESLSRAPRGIPRWSLYSARDNTLGFGQLAVSIADQNGRVGTILERQSNGEYINAGVDQVAVIRDSSGRITQFRPANVDSLFDSFVASLTTAGSTMLTNYIGALDGCVASLDENLGAMKAAFLELWNAESIGDYLADQWAAIQEIIAAFQSDPAAFFEEFLRDVIRADQFTEGNRARWAGMVMCDIALGVVLAGIGGAVAGPFARLFDRLPEIRVFKDDPDRNPNSVIGSPCNSFPTGTPVLLADGSYRAIDQIRPGDLVLAADEETGVWSSREVLDQWSHLDDGELATVSLTDGSQVSATDDHKFWVESDGRWVELEDVRPGDFLLTPHGVTEVASVDVSGPAQRLVWELDVAIDDTFAVHTGTQDVLVHNAKCAISQTEIDAIEAEFGPTNRDVVDVSTAPRFLGDQKPPEARDANGNWVGGWEQAPSPANWLGEIYDLGARGYAYELNGFVVRYNLNGYPDFSAYAIAAVDIGPFTGSRAGDFRAANAEIDREDFGSEAPQGFTWHHLEASDIEGTPLTDGGGRMELVDEQVHSLFSHSGGISTTR